MKAAIITSSDSGYAGEREDKSGSVIQEILEAQSGSKPSWMWQKSVIFLSV